MLGIGLAMLGGLAACGSVNASEHPDATLGGNGDAAAPIDGMPGAITLDPGFPMVANIDVNTGAMISVSGLSTPGPDRLLVGVLVWGGNADTDTPVSIAGGGLTWKQAVLTTFAKAEYTPGVSGDAIWTAWAADPLTDQPIVATRGSTTETAVMTMAVYSFANASQTIGATGSHDVANTPMIVDLTATTAGSWVIAGFHHGTANAVRQADTNTTYDIDDDPSKSVNGHFNAIGRFRGVTTGPGPIELGSSTTAGTFSLSSAVEVVPR
jgi:hypothetical protein